MHILFIEDMPEYKVVHLIDFLKYKKIDFTYEICKSVNSALRYCVQNKDKMDLIVNYEILPLLKEYWFDNKDKYEEWKKTLKGVLNG